MGQRFFRILGRSLSLVAGASLLVWLAGCGESAAEGEGGDSGESAGTPIAAVELVERDLSRELSTSATVRPLVRIRLASRASGTLKSVAVEAGERVEQGELLAALDMSEEEAELARARAQEEQARQAYRRASELRSNQLVSLSDYERARTELLVAESERRLWETRLGFGQVRAPRDAVVTQRYVEPGEAVDTQQTLFELTSMDALVLRLGISEMDVVHLERGQRVPIRLDALPDLAMKGRIRRIFPQAEDSSRLTTVEVSLPSEAAERGVRPGFLARVRMPIDARPNVVAVPASAVGEDGEAHYVYVVEDQTLQRRTIERGITRGQWTEVVSGLEPGEIVLATNPIDMSEGERVRIVGWRG